MGVANNREQGRFQSRERGDSSLKKGCSQHPKIGEVSVRRGGDSRNPGVQLTAENRGRFSGEREGALGPGAALTGMQPKIQGGGGGQEQPKHRGVANSRKQRRFQGAHQGCYAKGYILARGLDRAVKKGTRPRGLVTKWAGPVFFFRCKDVQYTVTKTFAISILCYRLQKTHIYFSE